MVWFSVDRMSYGAWQAAASELDVSWIDVQRERETRFRRANVGA
jgi:hypothetical protein